LRDKYKKYNYFIPHRIPESNAWYSSSCPYYYKEALKEIMRNNNNPLTTGKEILRVYNIKMMKQAIICQKISLNHGNRRGKDAKTI
jgi:hypothetical protein